MKTRKDLMLKLNSLLGTDYNWSRLSLLDLKRLVLAVKKLIAKIYIKNSRRKDEI